jgi:hypothetical protein
LLDTHPRPKKAFGVGHGSAQDAGGGFASGVVWKHGLQPSTTVKIPPAPFGKGGDILAFAKGRVYLGFGKEGDILRLFLDRMPERIACRQVSENSRTFPPFEKGGAGGIFYTIVMEKELIKFHHFSHS